MYACRFDDPTGAGPSWVFEDGQAELAATRSEDVPGVLAAVEEANRAGVFAAGYVSYEAAAGLDPVLTVHGAPASHSCARLPLAWFGLYATRRPAGQVPASPAPRPAPAASGSGPGGPWRWEHDGPWFAAAVGAVHERIAAGWTYQVNLTTRLLSECPEEPAELYRRLLYSQAGAYSALLQARDWAVVCGSPELFFVREGDRLVTRPMKGTAARHKGPEADRQAARQLVASPKERAENLMIVDLLRNDLGRLAPFGQVTVPALFEIEPYPAVWQMTSTVEARVPPACGLLETFRALFPCGSVTGAPKRATMALLAQLETGPRGVYCGAVGWSAPPDQCPSQRFAVAIRTAVIDRRTGWAEFGVGSGITADSTAAGEWAELQAKAAVLGTVPVR